MRNDCGGASESTCLVRVYVAPWNEALFSLGKKPFPVVLPEILMALEQFSTWKTILLYKQVVNATSMTRRVFRFGIGVMSMSESLWVDRA